MANVRSQTIAEVQQQGRAQATATHNTSKGTFKKWATRVAIMLGISYLVSVGMDMAIDAYHEAAAERAVKKEKAPPTMRNGEGRVYTTPLAEPAPTRYSFTATHDKWTVIEMVQGRCIFMHVTDLGRHDRNGHDVAVEVGGINQGAWIPFTEYLAAVHAHRTPFDAGFLRVRTVGDEPIDMTFEFRPWGTCDTRS